MKLYIKQKIFSWKDKFTVYNEDGSEQFFVEGEFFSWGKKLHIYDLFGNELAFIQQKVFTFLPKYFIYQNGISVAQIVKKLTFFKPSYDVIGPDWTIEGDFFSHEYSILSSGREITTISKKWFSWSDTYEIDIDSSVNIITALATVIVIDACNASNNN